LVFVMADRILRDGARAPPQDESLFINNQLNLIILQSTHPEEAPSRRPPWT
jgi:hypothetical protein